MPSSSSTKLHMLISVLALFWTRSLSISILITATGVIGFKQAGRASFGWMPVTLDPDNIEAQR